MLKRLETDSSGRKITKVIAIIHVKKLSSTRYCNHCMRAVNSAALMLRSASEKHPTGCKYQRPVEET